MLLILVLAVSAQYSYQFDESYDNEYSYNDEETNDEENYAETLNAKTSCYEKCASGFKTCSDQVKADLKKCKEKNQHLGAASCERICVEGPYRVCSNRQTTCTKRCRNLK